MRLTTRFALLVTTLIALVAAGLEVAAANTGPNAWCFRPSLIWHAVPDTGAYVPEISCEERELPAGGGEQWSSEATAALEVAPDDWSLPSRSIRQTTRWGWVHEYDASTGRAYVYGPMDRQDGQSPTTNTQPDVYLSIVCAADGSMHLSLLSDAAPLNGSHAIVWWTDRSEYRRAEVWEAEELSEGSDFYRAWASSPAQLWAEIRNSSRLYVLIFGDKSWQSAEAFVLRLSQLGVVEVLDYCGQSGDEHDRA